MSKTNTLRRFRVLKWIPRILMLGVIGFSAYVYFQYDNRNEGSAEGDKGPKRTIIAETNLVDFTQMDSGIPIYHVKAQRRKQFKSTSQELIDPEFTFFDKDGAETIRVKGKECRISKEMNTITVSGGTVVRSANGMKVEAEQMRYDSREQRFSTEDAAHFKWETLQGWSKGFTYHIETQTLILPTNPEIRYINKGSGNKKPIVMIGDQGKIERLSGFAYFEGNVLVTQGSDKVKADRIEAIFEPGGNKVQKITAMNNVKVKFGRPGKDDGEVKDVKVERVAATSPQKQTPSMGNVFSTDASSGKDLEAELVELYFYDDGATIKSFHAEENCTFVLHTFGKNNKPTENRIIKGEIFDAKFNELSDMEEFRAMENVSVKLQPLHKKQTDQPPQTIYCNDLLTTFVPQTGDVKEIHFNDGFKHVQDKRIVSSERAVYYSNLKKTDLIGSPEINDATFRIQSKEMELFEETSGIHAKGQVKSQFVRSEGKTPMTFPFSSPSNQPVYISSETMDWDAQKTEAVYTDKAKLWQEKNVITADKIIINDKEKTLSAHNKVHTIFYNKKDPNKAPKDVNAQTQSKPAQSQPTETADNFLMGESSETNEGPISVDAGIMNYVEKDRIIHFEKDVKIVTPSTKINSAKADFYLKEESSEFERLYAQENVQIEHEKKKGNGNYATFFNDERKLILEGQPRLAEAGKADITGHVLTLFLSDGRILIDGEEDGRATTTLQMEGNALTGSAPKSAGKGDKDKDSPGKKPGKDAGIPKPAKATNKKAPDAAPKNRKPD